jgi:hypothetical protein
MHDRINALITKLVEQGRLEELRALKAGTIRAVELVDADRRNATLANPDRPKLQTALDPLVERLFPGKGTNRRYRVSFKQLQDVLGGEAKVSDLFQVDWLRLEQAWAGSAADWNHVRRAVSRLLTLQLGKQHPERATLLERVPKRAEHERLVELAPEEFAAIIAPADPALQACFWTLAGTGMRAESEYHRLTRSHLGLQQIRIEASKNAKSHRVIPVASELWPHVLASVPCPFKPDYLARAATPSGRWRPGSTSTSCGPPWATPVWRRPRSMWYSERLGSMQKRWDGCCFRTPRSRCRCARNWPRAAGSRPASRPPGDSTRCAGPADPPT